MAQSRRKIGAFWFVGNSLLPKKYRERQFQGLIPLFRTERGRGETPGSKRPPPPPLRASPRGDDRKRIHLIYIIPPKRGGGGGGWAGHTERERAEMGSKGKGGKFSNIWPGDRHTHPRRETEKKRMEGWLAEAPRGTDCIE